MLACTYCGRRNPEAARFCDGCGCALLPAPAEPEAAPPGAEPPRRPGLDLEGIPGALVVRDGLPRPDWPVIDRWIEAHVPESEQAAARDASVVGWLNSLREGLGGDYRVWMMPAFVGLADIDEEEARQLSGFIESAEALIRTQLKHAAATEEPRAHVLILLAEEDDYLEYLSDFVEEGEHPRTGGVFLDREVPHVVVLATSPEAVRTCLAHELAHDALRHLPELPLWLNEGLAMTLGRAMLAQDTGLPSYQERAVAWAEELLEQRSFWDPESIQAFWAGASFSEASPAFAYGYTLAEMLVQSLAERDADAFLNFVLHARVEDGGQSAAQEWLGVDLGEAVGGLLGPNAWRPSRVKIAQYIRIRA